MSRHEDEDRKRSEEFAKLMMYLLVTVFSIVCLLSLFK